VFHYTNRMDDHDSEANERYAGKAGIFEKLEGDWMVASWCQKSIGSSTLAVLCYLGLIGQIIHPTEAHGATPFSCEHCEPRCLIVEHLCWLNCEQVATKGDCVKDLESLLRHPTSRQVIRVPIEQADVHNEFQRRTNNRLHPSLDSGNWTTILSYASTSVGVLRFGKEVVCKYVGQKAVLHPYVAGLCLLGEQFGWVGEMALTAVLGLGIGTVAYQVEVVFYPEQQYWVYTVQSEQPDYLWGGWKVAQEYLLPFSWPF